MSFAKYISIVRKSSSAVNGLECTSVPHIATVNMYFILFLLQYFAHLVFQYAYCVHIHCVSGTTTFTFQSQKFCLRHQVICSFLQRLILMSRSQFFHTYTSLSSISVILSKRLLICFSCCSGQRSAISRKPSNSNAMAFKSLARVCFALSRLC